MKYVSLLIFLFLMAPVLATNDAIWSCQDGITSVTNISNNIITLPCPFGCNPSSGLCNQSPVAVNSSSMFDTLAIIFFLGNLGVLFLKIYNVSKVGKGYDRVFIFITMMFSFMSWLILFVYFSFKPGFDTSFWLQVTSLIMYINFFVMILEIVILWYTSILEKRPKSREQKTLFPRL